MDDAKADWAKVAKFLSKFSKEAFNAETLVTDAENAQYRNAIIKKLVIALKEPSDDEGFMNWISEGVYKGRRTETVRSRLAKITKEAVEPVFNKRGQIYFFRFI